MSLTVFIVAVVLLRGLRLLLLAALKGFAAQPQKLGQCGHQRLLAARSMSAARMRNV
jgi:hypothetical protein